MAKVTFKDEWCKGCGLCVDNCPKKVLRLAPVRINAKGFHPAEAEFPDRCVGCAFCAISCPDAIITVER